MSDKTVSQSRLNPPREPVQCLRVRRWQALTGGSARHAVSGRSFDDLAREAEVADAA